MTSQAPSYHGYRFPPEIISHAVWLYHRSCLSFRDAEDLLAQRGVTVTYETIRHWCQTFGLDDARRLRRGRGRMGDTWCLDELFVNVQGRRQYLWRAVDQDGDVIDILVQSRRNRRAATRFFHKFIEGSFLPLLVNLTMPSVSLLGGAGACVPLRKRAPVSRRPRRARRRRSRSRASGRRGRSFRLGRAGQGRRSSRDSSRRRRTRAPS